MGNFRFGPFLLDVESRLLLREGEMVPLTAKVLDTLIVLVQSHGRVLEKGALLAALWPDTTVEEANLTQNISTLRKALGDHAKHHQYIATIPGRGYSFVGDVTALAPDAGPGAVTLVNASVGRRKWRTVWIGMSGGVLLTMALGWWALIRQHEGYMAAGSVDVVPFTSLPGSEERPAFSPDGRQIAFEWSGEDGANRQIWLKLIGAGTQLRLTSGPADFGPAWSPDGRYIAFYRDIPDGAGIYVVSALGGLERHIPNTGRPGWQLQWFPDGKRLILSSPAGTDDPVPLRSVDVATGEQRVLTTPPPGSSGDEWPRFSPDGKSIAFVRCTSRIACDIYVMPTNGGEPRPLTFDASWVPGLAWTSDSREIVFSSNRAGRLRLWRVAVGGGRPESLAIFGALNPAIANYGNRMAYVAPVLNANLWRIDLGSDSPVSTQIKSLKFMRLVSSTRRETDPQYSPDGRNIAFSSARSGSHEIWVAGADGGNAVQITDLKHSTAGSPRWSFDGSQIAFDAGSTGNPDIYVIQADGGALRRITNHAAENVVPSWSHDGKEIYFASNRSGTFQIWKVLAAAGESRSTPAVPITRGGGFGAFETADGKYLYYAKGRGKNGLWRLNLALGAQSEEPVLDSLEYWGWWALAPQGIYYFKSEGHQPTVGTMQQPTVGTKMYVRLEFFDFSTRQSRDVVKLEKPVSPTGAVLTVSPGGQYLVYSQIDQTGSDVMLVENFR